MGKATSDWRLSYLRHLKADQGDPIARGRENMGNVTGPFILNFTLPLLVVMHFHLRAGMRLQGPSSVVFRSTWQELEAQK